MLCCGAGRGRVVRRERNYSGAMRAALPRGLAARAGRAEGGSMLKWTGDWSPSVQCQPGRAGDLYPQHAMGICGCHIQQWSTSVRSALLP
eukprot:5186709-Pleurochrysis_carterae.AAC.3